MQTGKKFKVILSLFLITGSLYFIFVGLTRGAGFLIPLITAIILAMVMNPVVQKFRSWGVAKGWAVLYADLLIVLFIAFMIFLLAAQANSIAGNWDQIEQRVKPKIEQAQDYLNNKLNMGQVMGQGQESGEVNERGGGMQQQGQQEQDTQEQNKENQNKQQQDQSGQNKQQQNPQEQKQAQKKQQSGSSEQQSSFSLSPDTIRNQLTGIIQNFISFISNLLLILVYVFFFLYYREKFENTIVGLTGDAHEKTTRDILEKMANTAQHYLFGRFTLILILAVLYMIGFSLLGLKYSIFISILAALFSLVPYVGNVVALFLAMAMSFISGDSGIGQLIAIFTVFGVIQFVESYILEPYVVGKEVDLNPVVVIVGVVLGGIVWGVMGMILAIPILGIIKVILDNIPSLRPLGYALDERDVGSGDGGKQEKIKQWFRDKLKKGK